MHEPKLKELLPAFKKSGIVGVHLMAVARWVELSTKEEADPATSRLLLPPIQRSAVWRWSQVLAFWDSVFRGMPVGSFYVMPSHDGSMKGRHADGREAKNVEARSGDYFLLDGQQRMRALLAGLVKKNADKRCLWIDLKKLGDTKDPGAVLPCLFLTSEAQPFGYDPVTGNKLRAEDRREARETFSKDGEKKGREKGEEDQWLWKAYEGESTKERCAYNQDLFDHTIELRKGSTLLHSLATPPRPFKASPATIPLWKLIECCKSIDVSSCGASDELRDVLSRWDASTDPDINAKVRDMAQADLTMLAGMLARLRAAQVALIQVQVGNVPGQVKPQDLPLLFTRVGAGGSPLTQDERLYSIYKHYVPEVHTLVERIHEYVGRVLPPTGIAMTALRIANVESQEKDDRNVSLGTPDEKAFRQAMQDDMASKGGSTLKKRLNQLLPLEEGPGPLEGAFRFLRDAVSGQLKDGQSGIENPACAFWLPDVLLADLSQNLWQVLAYWAFKNRDAACAQQSRPELVRFILFWHLCVQNDDKAGNRAFNTIRQQEKQQPCFPGRALYEALIDKDGGNPVTLELSLPELVCKVISLGETQSGLWPSWNERFEDPERVSNPSLRKAEQLAACWWPRRGGGERLLPWLQRQYIADMFGDYAPLSNHEDDLPYDVDHICAGNRFNGDWRKVMFPDLIHNEAALRKLRDNRGLMGNSIGNLQLLDMSENRKAGDTHHSKKPWTYKESMKAAWWEEAEEKVKLDDPKSGNVEWGQQDRIGFQSAVEQRAVFLYWRFFEDLEYQDKWGIPSQLTATSEI